MEVERFTYLPMITKALGRADGLLITAVKSHVRGTLPSDPVSSMILPITFNAYFIIFVYHSSRQQNSFPLLDREAGDTVCNLMMSRSLIYQT
jgi:hypothetical protein